MRENQRWILKSVAKTLGACTVGVLLAFLIFLGRLAYAPIDLSDFTRLIEKSLTGSTKGMQVHLKNPRLTWNLGEGGLVLEAQRVTLSDKNGTRTQIPKLTATFSPFSLLRGQLAPRSLYLKKPHVSLSGSLASLKEEDRVMVTWIKELLGLSEGLSQGTSGGSRFSSPLQKLDIQNAQIDFPALDHPEEKGWNLHRLTVQLNRKTSGFSGHLSGSLSERGAEKHSQQPKTIQLGMEYDTSARSISLTLDLDHVSGRFLGVLGNLAGFYPFETRTETEAGTDIDPSRSIEATSQSRPQDFSVSGNLQVSYHLDQGLQEAKVDLTTPRGDLLLPPYFPLPLTLQDVVVKAHFKNNLLHLNRFSFSSPSSLLASKLPLPSPSSHSLKSRTSPKLLAAASALASAPLPHAHLQGTAAWNPDRRTWDLQVTGEVTHVPLADLRIFWPPTLGSVPREWMLQNMTQGVATKATLQGSGSLDFGSEKNSKSPQSLKNFTSPTFILKDLSGDIAFKEASVDYLDGMPLAVQAQGVAHYTPQTFDIAIKSGKAAGTRLMVSQGQVKITELDQEDQNIALDLRIEGPLEDALKFIDNKPLTFLKKLDLNLKNPKGQTQTELSLQFPLEQKVTLDQVKVKAVSKVTRAKVTYPFLGQDLSLEDASFTLTATHHDLKMEGSGKVQGQPLTLQWTKAFIPGASPLSTFHLQSAAQASFLKNFSGFESSTLQGTLPLSLLYRQQTADKGTLTGEVNLGPAYLNLFGFEKPLQFPGKIKFVVDFLKGHPAHLKEATATSGGGLDVKVSGYFNSGEDGISVKNLTLLKGRMGKTNLTGQIGESKRQGKPLYKIDLRGDALDLQPFLETLTPEKQKDLGVNFEALIRVQKVYLEQGCIFYNNDLRMTYEGEKIKALRYLATLDSVPASLIASPKVPRISLSLLPETYHTRKLLLTTNNAGIFLRSFTTFDNVKSGSLTLVALHEDSAKTNPWQGRLRIENFYLNKAPVLSKFLSLAFPTGFLHLFSDEGLPFTELKLKFKAFPDRVNILNGRAFGSSLGLSLKGSVDQGYKNLHLYGTLIPAYFLNTLVSKIPLVGELLSGGKGEGIFGFSYKISGPRSNPSMSVNPLSALTPGIFRKIFSPNEIDEDREEGKEETSPSPSSMPPRK